MNFGSFRAENPGKQSDWITPKGEIDLTIQMRDLEEMDANPKSCTPVKILVCGLCIRRTRKIISFF